MKQDWLSWVFMLIGLGITISFFVCSIQNHDLWPILVALASVVTGSLSWYRRRHRA